MKHLFFLLLLSSLAFAQEEDIGVERETGLPTVGGFFAPSQSEPSSEEDDSFFQLAPSQPSEIEVTSEGSSRYDAPTQTVIFEEKVEIKGDNGLIIYADKAVLDGSNERVIAQGNVSVFTGPLLYHGDEAIYYYKSKKIDTKKIRTSFDPFLLEADEFKTIEKKGLPIQIARNAKVTTDDYQNPSYWIKADKLALHPDETVIFEGVKIEIGGRTVFWLPYLAQSLNGDLGYHFTPGAMSHLGGFLKNRYGVYLGGKKDPDTLRIDDPSYLLQSHLDLYTRRGIGTGFELFDLDYADQEELGTYSAYWIYDRDHRTERTDTSRTDFDQRNRFKLSIKDRREFGEIWGGATWFDTDLTYLSDQFVLEDFFEDQFRVEPVPDNQLSLSHVRERAVGTLRTRFQVNTFDEVDSRLPELSYDYTRTRIKNSPFLYENQSSLGYYQRNLPRGSELDEDQGYFRAHTWHELSTPYTIVDGITFTPRAGAGYTHYNDRQNNSIDRWSTFVGADLALKFSQNYSSFVSEKWGINGLAHHVQPYLNLSVLEVSGNEDFAFAPVDTLTPITRPRPLNVGRYSAIDELDDWSIIRTGVRQNFLTKRNGETYQWLYLDTHFDTDLRRQGSASALSNIYNEIDWTPLPWFSLNLDTQFPLSNSGSDFTEVYLSSSITTSQNTTFTVGFQFLDNHPIISDITQLDYSIYHRLNSQWGVGLSHQWRLDQDVLTRQEYTLSRNLKSWIFSLQLYHRDFIVDTEWGLTFGLTLRDFPDISLPLSIQR